jgi:NitT/TauT family transport system substrate-binding protein
MRKMQRRNEENIMKKHKLTGVFAVVGVMSVLLTACGNAGTVGTDAQNEEKTASDTTELTAGTSDNNIEKTAAGDADPASDEPVTIRVGVCSGDQNQYLKIVDEHTGLFKDNGIDLQVSEFAAGINTIDAITTGQLDIGNFADYAGVNRIGNTLADTELRAFTKTYVSTFNNLYVNPDVIKTGDDLQNATLISRAGVVVEYEYGKLFEAYNIDPTKTTIVNVTSAQEALALASTNSGDAYWANLQTAPMFEEYGWVPFVGLEDIDAVMYAYLVANESYLEEHHDDVVKFLELSEEGFQYISDNLDEVAEWVNEETGLEKDLVISGWESYQYSYSFTQDAYEALAKVEKWCYENGKFDTDYDVADYINTDALKEAFPDRVTWQAQ